MTEYLCRQLPTSVDGEGTAILALQFDGFQADVVSRAVKWGDRSAALLRQISRAGIESGKEEGRQLPLTSLRLMLQVGLPDALAVAEDLGQPQTTEPHNFVWGSSADLAASVGAIVAGWARTSLAHWAERVGVGSALVNALAQAVGSDLVTHQATQRVAAVPGSGEFRAARQAIFQLLTEALSGRELFDGLGPVRRVVKGTLSDSIEFETWPVAAHDAHYSMVARLTLVTLPAHDRLVLVVDASRRRWCRSIPGPGRLGGRGKVRMRMVAKSRLSAFSLDVPVSRGVISSNLPTSFLIGALQEGYDFAKPIDEMVEKARVSDPVFVGLPFSPKYGSHPIGQGASTRDALDLFDAVADLLVPMGFSRVEGDKVGRPSRWSSESHAVLQSQDLLAEIAYQLGFNQLSPEALEASLDSFLINEPAPDEHDRAVIENARQKLERLRDDNAARLGRLYPRRPTLVVVAAREHDRLQLKRIIEALYGSSLIVETRALPEGTHGPRINRTSSVADRFNARVQKWRPLAEDLAAEFDAPHVLVQAPRFFEKMPDDPVAKAAGRYALAVHGRANVQYLLPLIGGWKGLNQYLMRLQSALGDVLFAHAGGIDDPAGLFTRTLPDSLHDTVLGISLVTQARRRTGHKAAKIVLATKVVLAEGRTYGRLCWGSGNQSSEWRPLEEVLRAAAELETPDLGDTKADETIAYQGFVLDVLATAKARGERPLVLLDATSAAGLWPWLRDTDISERPLLGPEAIDIASGWDGVAFARIRQRETPCLVIRKTVGYQVLDPTTLEASGQTIAVNKPTIVPQVVKVATGVPTYWAISGDLEQLPRGISVYRTLDGAVTEKVAKIVKPIPDGLKVLKEGGRPALDRAPYRRPNSLEISIPVMPARADPDKIALLIASLREGLSHTGLSTALPPPLSFERKLRDYITRFSIDDLDEEDDESATSSAEFDDESALAAELDDAIDAQLEEIGTDPEDSFISSLRSGSALVPFVRSPVAVPSSMSEPAAGFQLVKEPVLPVPEFVTMEFLESYISYSKEAAEKLTRGRALVEEASGFAAWPKSAPSRKNFYSLIRAALAYPGAFFAMERLLVNGNDTPYGQAPVLIGSLIDKYPVTVLAAARVDAVNVFDLIKQMEPHLVRAHIYLRQMRGGVHPGYSEWVFSDPSLEHLREFQAAAEDYLLFSEGELFGDIDFGADEESSMPYARDLPKVKAHWPLPPMADEAGGDAVGDGAGEPGKSNGSMSAQPSIGEAASIEAEIAEQEAMAAKKDEEVSNMDNAVSASHPCEPEGQWSEKITALRALLEGARAPSVEVIAVVRLCANELEEIAHRYSALQGVDTAPLIERLERCVARLREAGIETVLEGERAKALDAALWAEVDRVLQDVESQLHEAEQIEAEFVSGPLTKAMRSNLANKQMAFYRAAEEQCHTANELLAAPPPSEETPAPVAEIVVPLPTPEPLPAPPPALVDEAQTSAQTADVGAPVVMPAPPIAPIAVPATPLPITVEDDNSSVDEHSLVLEDKPLIPPEPETDLARDRREAAVWERLDDLVAGQEFGLAYHLRTAAGVVFGGDHSTWTPEELRLAAVGGRVTGLSYHEQQDLVHTYTDVVDIAQRIVAVADDGEPRNLARRLILFASILEPAVFPTDMFRIVPQIVEILMVNGVGNCFYRLAKAVTDASNRNVRLTPNALAILREDQDSSVAEASLKASIIERLELLKGANYTYVPARTLVTTLFNREWQLGQLEAAFKSGSPMPIAADFADQYADRDGALSLMHLVESKWPVGKGDMVDGRVRERILNQITTIAGLCGNLVQNQSSLMAARKDRYSREAIAEVYAEVNKGMDQAKRELNALADRDSPLIAGAVLTAKAAIRRIEEIFAGTAKPLGTIDRMAALHGGLLWLPGLSFASNWLPNPYDEPEIIATIMHAPLPIAPVPVSLAIDAGAGTKRLTLSELVATVEARKSEGSYIAASELLALAPIYGIAEEETKKLRDGLVADRTMRRSRLKTEIASVSSQLDRARRLAALSLDEIADMEAVLGSLDVQQIPREYSMEELREEKQPEMLLDFCTVEATVDRYEAQLKSVMAPKRAALMDEVMELRRDNTISAENEVALRNLLENDDLSTAADWIAFLKDPVGRQAVSIGGRVNRRFSDFYPAYPASLIREPVGLADVGDLVRDGADRGLLQFSLIPPTRREEALDVLRAWREMHGLLRKSVDRRTIQSAIVTFLEGIGMIDVSAQTVVALDGNQSRKNYAGDFKLRIPGESSLLLPDFGPTETGNLWRVAVCNSEPSEEDLKELVPADRAALVFVFAVVAPAARIEIRKSCITRHFKALVIDEAALLFALAAAQYRPYTLIECAQPFSYAFPYRDRGTEIVAPEMFKGRRREIQQLTERAGSHIVYGGRRLGKTALLRHIEANPPANTVVGFVELKRFYTAESPSIWANISSCISVVFSKNGVKSADEFASAISEWLDRHPTQSILLLMDEADEFIQRDAKENYAVFLRLQNLMSRGGGNKRFKFVIAGLHNVSRLIDTMELSPESGDNSPLRQIDTNPVCVGPLIDKDLGDAESLVRDPLAALGFEFEAREDVWRILSQTNYYPILIHLFCQGLLTKLFEQAKTTPDEWVISRQLVSQALADGVKDMQQTFDKTIRLDGSRYEFLACIIALHLLLEVQNGAVDHGMSPLEIMGQARKRWPAEFNERSTLNELDMLLEEMVGLGVLRRLPGNRWTLRSRTLLTLLGTEQDIMGRLYDFENRPPPESFDPRQVRRDITVGGEKLWSPLPRRVEQKLLGTSRTPSAAVQIIFGMPAFGLEQVPPALRVYGSEARFKDRLVVQLAKCSRLEELGEQLRRIRTRTPRHVVVVGPNAPWTPKWVVEAIKYTRMNDRSISVVFVGDATAALRWAEAPPSASSMFEVSRIEPWSAAEVTTLADILHVSHNVRELLDQTGGAGTLVQMVMKVLGQSGKEAAYEKLRSYCKDKGVQGLYGLADPICDGIREFCQMAHEGLSMTLSDYEAFVAGFPDNGVAVRQALMLLGVVILDKANKDNALSDLIAVNPLFAKMVGSP